MTTPKTKFSALANDELVRLLLDHIEKTNNAKPILAMNPVPMPIQDWIALRDANQILLHEIALIEQELHIRTRNNLSFIAHDDATSQGCTMCGNEWKSLNAAGYCSSCWQVWNG